MSDPDDDILVTVTHLRSIDSSLGGSGLMIFQGIDEEGRTVSFGVDHRPGTVLVDELFEGQQPRCEVPPWAILAVVDGES